MAPPGYFGVVDQRLIFGLGVSFVASFVRWRIPALPKPMATFGIVVGLGLIAWAAMPDLPVAYVVAGILVLALSSAIIDAMITKKLGPSIRGMTLSGSGGVSTPVGFQASGAE